MMVKFESLNVGQRFFDPYCGEYFTKVCGNAAEMETGGDAFTGSLATFDAGEMVDEE